MGSIVGFMFLVGGMLAISPIALIVSKTKWFNQFIDNIINRKI